MQFGQRLREERLRRHLSQEALAEALALSARSIRRWERGQALPQVSIRLQISCFFGLPPDALFDEKEIQSVNKPHWNVPYLRNPFFTGREETLTTLHASLCVEQSAALAQVYALQGLGGVGKTQVALEYAYQYAQEYQAVLWVGAETTESIIFSFQSIAESLQLPQRDDQDQQQVIKAVQGWLITHDHWLLIFDNVEDLGLMNRFLPSLRQGAVLFTTRLQALGTYAEGIRLFPMGYDEGLLFLLRRAKLVDAQATIEQMRALSSRLPLQYTAAEELVQAMDGLPLALDQAGAYLEETQCGLPAYLDLFRTQSATLLKQRGEDASAHPASVSTTLTLAIKATTQRHPVVRELLCVCALLQPDAIPEELFLQGSEHLGQAIAEVARDTLDWNQVVAVACSYSLLSRQSEARAFSIHRLLQAVLMDTMTEQELQTWRLRVVRALDALFPEERPTTEYTPWWAQCERLVPHALLSLQREGGDKDSLAVASLSYKTAQYLRGRGQYGEAESFYQRALRIREQLLGSDHQETAHVLNNLAVLYWRMAKYTEAQPLFEQALRVRKQTLGGNHPDVATTLNYLGLLFWKKGQYTEAEPLLQRALQIWEQTLDPDHPNVAYPLNNLAILYAEQGKYEKAEIFFRRALDAWEQTRPSDHPDIAQGLHNLAEIFLLQEKFAEATPLFQRALSLREQSFGPDHPAVAETLNSLAEIYRKQGHYREAEPLYQRVLRIWERSQGADHPDIAVVLAELANLYRDQGRYTEAEPLYQRARAIREQRLGSRHPETAQILHDLAVFVQRRGDTREALSLVEQALEIRLESLGEANPKTTLSQTLYTQLVQEQDERTRSDSAPKN